MNEEIKKLNDQISSIEQEFRASSNERKSQINQINLQIRTRINLYRLGYGRKTTKFNI